jgi:hypothetical protein
MSAVHLIREKNSLSRLITPQFHTGTHGESPEHHTEVPRSRIERQTPVSLAYHSTLGETHYNIM